MRRPVTPRDYATHLFPLSSSSFSSSFVSSSRSFSFLESVAATFARINFDHGDQTAWCRLYIIDFINYKMEYRWLSRNTGGNYRFGEEGFLALKGFAFRRALLRKLIRVYLFLSSFLFSFFSPPGEGGLVPNEGNPTSPSILINTTAIWRTQPILHARVNPQRGKSSCFNFSSDYRPASVLRPRNTCSKNER